MNASNPLSMANAATLSYCHALLAQAIDVVRQHDVLFSNPFEDPFGVRAGPFSIHTGPHVRHIIEHFDALKNVLGETAPGRVLNYDNRPRDVRIETSTAFAIARLEGLQDWLADHGWSDAILDLVLEMHLCGGLRGEHQFVVQSSVGRELTFLASHTVHHFAVLQAYAQQEGRSLGQDFGKAPATVAFESWAVTQ